MGVQGRKWIKTTAKRAYWESKKYWKAYFQARDEHLNRESPTSFIKRTFNKILERVDPLEAAAIIGGTILVHEVIFKAAPFVNKLTQLTGGSLEPTGIITGLEQYLLKWIFGKAGPIQELKPDAYAEIIMWLAAFAISYFAFKHGDDVLLVANNMLGLAALSA